MLRPRRLRARLVLAMVGTSVVTLAVATLTLLPPLDTRLERGRLGELRQVAETARLSISEMRYPDLAAGRTPGRRFVVGLARRTGGAAALVDRHGRVLAATDRDDPAIAASATLPRREGVRDGIRDGAAIVRAQARAEDGERVVLVLRKPLDDTRAAVVSIRRTLPIAALVGLVTGGLLAVLASSGVLRRLHRLRDDARALHAEGLEHVVAVDGAGDEVDEVARALEEMRGRLVHQEAARQEFLAVASHELRTPLAALRANLELLHEGLDGSAPDTGAARTRAESALRQTHRLSTLAGDLLDLSRVDGGARPALQAVELCELSERLAEELRGALRVADRTLTVEGEPPVHALADAGALLRILGILVDNARVHGAGAVVLRVARDDGHAVVRVCDDGPGLPPADRERLFERFVRGPDAHGRPGSGLGLTIARGLATAMDGHLVVAADEPGSCLALTLPAWSSGAVGDG
jgi:signal transduction histidine kinase